MSESRDSAASWRLATFAVVVGLPILAVAIAIPGRNQVRSPAAPGSTPLDPPRGASDHVGGHVPEYLTGDECLFCHRMDIGPRFASDPHNLTIRPIDEVPEAKERLGRDPATKDLTGAVIYLLGGSRRGASSGPQGRTEAWRSSRRSGTHRRPLGTDVSSIVSNPDGPPGHSARRAQAATPRASNPRRGPSRRSPSTATSATGPWTRDIPMIRPSSTFPARRRDPARRDFDLRPMPRPDGPLPEHRAALPEHIRRGRQPLPRFRGGLLGRGDCPAPSGRSPRPR